MSLRIKFKENFHLFIPGLVLLIRFPQMLFPIRNDAGSFAYTSWLISMGNVPYRDFFLSRTPLMQTINAIPMWVLGPSVIIPLVMETCIVALSCLLIFYNIKYLSKDYWLSITSSIVYALYASKYSISAGGGATENYVVFFYMLALFFILKNDWTKPTISSSLLFGLSIGCAVLVRQIGIISIIVWSLFWVFTLEFKAIRVRILASYLTGIFVVIMIFFTFLFITDSFSNFLNIQLNFGTNYFATGVSGQGWIIGNLQLVGKILRQTVPLTPLIFVGLFQLDRKWLPIIVFGIAGTMETFILGSTGYLHYAIIILPLLSILAALGIRTIYVWAVQNNNDQRKKILIGFFSLLLILQPGLIAVSHISYVKKRISQDLLGEGSFMENNFVLYRVASEIRNQLNKDEFFAFWGYRRFIPILAQRRHLQQTPDLDWFTIDSPKDTLDVKRSQFVSAINNENPKIVLLQTNLKKESARPPETLLELLSQRYELLGTYGPSSISVSGFSGYNGDSYQLWRLNNEK